MKNWGYYPTGGRVSTYWYVRHPWRFMRLVQSLEFIDRRGVEWVAKKGTEINGASIPWFFRRVFPVYIGVYRRASILHDAGCVDKTRPSWEVHRMFYEAIRCDALLHTTNIRNWWERTIAEYQYAAEAWVMWAAVRTFGPRFRGNRAG